MADRAVDGLREKLGRKWPAIEAARRGCVGLCAPHVGRTIVILFQAVFLL